jgi:DNA-binding CsgD family transcriptional regulator
MASPPAFSDSGDHIARTTLCRYAFRRIFGQAERRRRRALVPVTREAVDDDPDPGFVLLDAVGLVDAATPRARQLLEDWFGQAPHGRLPEQVGRWLRMRLSPALDAPAVPLRRVRAATSLTIDLAAHDVLVIEQHRQAEDATGLTDREREVLSCVAVGMANKEIAAFFSIAEGTVRKHLEHAYAKLGVRSRTAAIARLSARGLTTGIALVAGGVV